MTLPQDAFPFCQISVEHATLTQWLSMDENFDAWNMLLDLFMDFCHNALNELSLEAIGMPGLKQT